MQKQYPDSYLREQRAERVSNSLGEDEMADVRKHMIFHDLRTDERTEQESVYPDRLDRYRREGNRNGKQF